MIVLVTSSGSPSALVSLSVASFGSSESSVTTFPNVSVPETDAVLVTNPEFISS